MASTAASADFHTSFQKDKRSISSLFESDPLPLFDISSRLQQLRAGLSANLAFLPAYDRRSYDLQLKELESRVSQLRARDKPKSRFAFSAKAKAQAGPSTSSTSKPSLDATPASQTAEPVLSSLSTSAAVHLISDLSRQVIRPPLAVQDGYTISLVSLSSCIIDLRPSPGSTVADSTDNGRGRKPKTLTSLHAKDLKGCILVAPVMDGSAILEGVEDCLLILGAQQFRIHSSSRTVILLHVPSNPIIEHSSELHFGAYPEHMDHPAFPSKHAQVQDFDWIREGPSPNWSSLGTVASELLCSQEDLDEISHMGARDETSITAVLNRMLSGLRGLQPDAS